MERFVQGVIFHFGTKSYEHDRPGSFFRSTDKGNPVQTESVMSKTRTYHGRVVAAKRTAGGRAGRCGAGHGADGTVCAGNNRLSCPPGRRRQLFSTTSRKHEQTNSYGNRWGNKASGSAFGQRLAPAVNPWNHERSSCLAADPCTVAQLSL